MGGKHRKRKETDDKILFVKNYIKNRAFGFFANARIKYLQ